MTDTTSRTHSVLFDDEYDLAPSAPTEPASEPPVDTEAAVQPSAPQAGPRDVGIVCIGDGFVTGYGDPKGLGWVSRVVGRTVHPDLDITMYNLGVRGDSSADMVTRWRNECMVRWQDRWDRRLVIGMGQEDAVQGLTTARSRLNLANVLDDAKSRGISAFVVGPPPTSDPDLNRRLEVVVEAQADVCMRRSVPFVDCYYPLREHEQWATELQASRDGRHPGQAGYGLLAWLVLHGGWENWLEIDPGV